MHAAFLPLIWKDAAKLNAVGARAARRLAENLCVEVARTESFEFSMRRKQLYIMAIDQVYLQYPKLYEFPNIGVMSTQKFPIIFGITVVGIFGVSIFGLVAVCILPL